MSRYIDEYRGRFGVEPICRTLGVSASAYYQRATGQRSTRAVEDQRLREVVRELHAENYYAYGSRRMWKALQRAGEQVGRGRVDRLMRHAGVQGAKRRGKPWRTTRPDRAARHQRDLVQRDFSASGPDQLWVADLTYLRCWEGVQRGGVVADQSADRDAAKARALDGTQREPGPCRYARACENFGVGPSADVIDRHMQKPPPSPVSRGCVGRPASVLEPSAAGRQRRHVEM